MSKVYRQAVIYSEGEMRRELSAPASYTVAEARAAAAKDMTDHLRSRPGVSPATITLDETCVQMYLPVGVADGMTVGDIGSDFLVVVRPKPKPGSTIAPSPITDALRDVTAELAEARAQLGAPCPSMEVACRPPRAPPLLSEDDMQVDIYRLVNPEPDTIIGGIGDVVMLLQSKMEPGSATRPGSIIDAYRNATAELAEVRELLRSLHRLSTVEYGGVQLEHGAAATEETLEAIPVEESSTSID